MAVPKLVGKREPKLSLSERVGLLIKLAIPPPRAGPL